MLYLDGKESYSFGLMKAGCSIESEDMDATKAIKVGQV